MKYLNKLLLILTLMAGTAFVASGQIVTVEKSDKQIADSIRA